MKYLRNLLFYLFVVILLMFVLTFFITFFNYYDLLNAKLTNVFKVIIPLLSLSIGGYLMGRRVSKNGYLEGLKIGGLFVFIVLIINAVFFDIGIKNIVFYVLLLITSAFGGMIGINMKKE